MASISTSEDSGIITPTTTDAELLFRKESLEFDSKMGNKMNALTGNDAPWPGYAYIISEGNTNKVMTFSNKSVVLEDYDGKSTQSWVCHSNDGWLGFINDTGDTSSYMGWESDKNPRLICKVPWLKWNENFCVRKRPQDGFQMLMRRGDRALCPLGKDKDGHLAPVKDSKAWWGFTKI